MYYVRDQINSDQQLYVVNCWGGSEYIFISIFCLFLIVAVIEKKRSTKTLYCPYYPDTLCSLPFSSYINHLPYYKIHCHYQSGQQQESHMW